MSASEAESQLLTDLTAAKEAHVNRALKYLYAQTRETVFQNVRLNGGSDPQAADVLQNAVIILWEKVRDGKFKGESRLTTFLIGIAKMVWKDHFRKGSREIAGWENLPEVEAEPDMDDEVSAEDKLKLARLIEIMSFKCKQLLLMVFWQKQSMKAIAAELGFKNDQNAKNKKRKCLDELERMWKK